jgi:hypothetical protein
VEINENIFIVKNTVFESIVFSKQIIIREEYFELKKMKIIENKEAFLNIADFFVYDDYFIKEEFSVPHLSPIP